MIFDCTSQSKRGVLRTSDEFDVSAKDKPLIVDVALINKDGPYAAKPNADIYKRALRETCDEFGVVIGINETKDGFQLGFENASDYGPIMESTEKRYLELAKDHHLAYIYAKSWWLNREEEQGGSAGHKDAQQGKAAFADWHAEHYHKDGSPRSEMTITPAPEDQL